MKQQLYWIQRLLQTSKRSKFWSNNYVEYKIYGDKNKILSIKEYLDENKPHLKDIIYKPKKPDIWKIQLTIVINFVASKDVDEKHEIHSKSVKTEVMTYDEADKVIEELLESLLHRYQTSLETSIRGSDFIFVFTCCVTNVIK